MTQRNQQGPSVGWWRQFKLWLRLVGQIDEINLELDALNHTLRGLVGQQNALRTEVQALDMRIQEQIDSLKDHFDRRYGRITAQTRKQALTMRSQSPALPQLAPISTVAEETDLDRFYADFDDVFRGERADLKNSLRPYIERIRAASVGTIDRPILDVGCGRGEWLELLRDEALFGIGIDVNAVVIDRCQHFGLDARHGDVITYLKNCADGSLGAITGFNIVEYLPLPVLMAFFDHARRVLVPGGLLLLATPNPETITVGVTAFFNDPRHRHLIPPQVLQFMVEHRGLVEAEILREHLSTTGLVQAGTRDGALGNPELFRPQDYVVLAYGPPVSTGIV